MAFLPTNPVTVYGIGPTGLAVPLLLDANGNITAALSAGTAVVGKVGIDQTTPGTTNAVQLTGALPAGTALLGKVGIDQTTPGTTNGVQVNAGEAHLGQVGGTTPRVTAQMVRPGDATQYAIGDLIGNSQTAASVVPIEFTVARISNGSGRVTGCRCTVTAASGTIVLPKFDLLLFRPATNIPFTAASYPADNAALNVSAAAMIELVGILSFSDAAWRNQAGGATAAGDHIYQAVPLSSGRLYAPFNLATLSSQKLLALLQAQNTWNPGNVANTFDFALDVDQD